MNTLMNYFQLDYTNELGGIESLIAESNVADKLEWYKGYYMEVMMSGFLLEQNLLHQLTER